MGNQPMIRFLHCMFQVNNLLKRRRELYQRYVSGVINRSQSQLSDTRRADVQKEVGDVPQFSPRANGVEVNNSVPGNHGSCDGDPSDSRWKLELAWLPKALEPAMQLYRWALPAGNGTETKPPPSSRSLAEIIASIQKSKIGIEGWSLSDLTVGLYLIYLRQASQNPLEDVKGVEISSEPLVLDLIYHLELAKGCYKKSSASLARVSMLRESNVLKFVKDSSVLRPGYYIGIDPRKKLVVLGIRGTHTVYDLITDVVSSSDKEVTFEGYSTHFGTAEAARWFLTHEIGTLRSCLTKYKGYQLRLVGHSLGGAIASLLAIMLRKMSHEELGFSPEIVSAMGYATPPCVSKELAEKCCDFVTTVVMQDDIVPRLSMASLARLRTEIIQTDWMSVVEKEDWKSIIDLVTNAKHFVSSVQDVARKLADYAKFGNKRDSSADPTEKGYHNIPNDSSGSKHEQENVDNLKKNESALSVPEELFVPGTVFYLKRNTENVGNEYFTLWRRDPSEHFQKIVLSSNLISDHKCDSHYYALRDVLKGLPGFGYERTL